MPVAAVGALGIVAGAVYLSSDDDEEEEEQETLKKDNDGAGAHDGEDLLADELDENAAEDERAVTRATGADAELAGQTDLADASDATGSGGSGGLVPPITGRRKGAEPGAPTGAESQFADGEEIDTGGGIGSSDEAGFPWVAGAVAAGAAAHEHLKDRKRKKKQDEAKAKAAAEQKARKEAEEKKKADDKARATQSLKRTVDMPAPIVDDSLDVDSVKISSLGADSVDADSVDADSVDLGSVGLGSVDLDSVDSASAEALLNSEIDEGRPATEAIPTDNLYDSTDPDEPQIFDSVDESMEVGGVYDSTDPGDDADVAEIMDSGTGEIPLDGMLDSTDPDADDDEGPAKQDPETVQRLKRTAKTVPQMQVPEIEDLDDDARPADRKATEELPTPELPDDDD